MKIFCLVISGLFCLNLFAYNAENSLKTDQEKIFLSPSKDIKQKKNETTNDNIKKQKKRDISNKDDKIIVLASPQNIFENEKEETENSFEEQ